MVIILTFPSSLLHLSHLCSNKILVGSTINLAIPNFQWIWFVPKNVYIMLDSII